MRDNKGRVMTLRIVITDSEASAWLWEAHTSPLHGIDVRALADGDLFTERDKLAEQLDKAEEILATYGRYLDA